MVHVVIAWRMSCKRAKSQGLHPPKLSRLHDTGYRVPEERTVVAVVPLVMLMVHAVLVKLVKICTATRGGVGV